MRIVLETRRLVLSELSLADLDFVAAMTGAPWVMRYYPKRLNREEAAAGIRQQLDRYARDGIGAWLAREKSSGRAVGRVGLMRRPVNGVVETEIAWMIHRPYQRCGYASEGAAACRDHALTALALPLVEPGGLMLTCSCSGLMPLDEFQKTVSAAAPPGRRVQILESRGAAPDHPVATDCPETAYLKALWLRVE